MNVNAAKEAKPPLTPQRKAVLVASTVLALGVGFWVVKNLLPLFAPELFVEGNPGPPAPPPPAAPPPPPMASGSDSSSADETPEQAAAHALDVAETRWTDAHIAEDPAQAVKAFKAIADREGTKAAAKGKAKLEAIRAKYAKELEAANAAAMDEVKRVAAAAAPALADLDNVAVVLSWRAVEERFAGLPAADAATKEREKVQAAWDAVPQVEKTARQKYRALPATAKDDAARIDQALTSDELAKAYPDALYGKKAAAHRDELLVQVADAMEKLSLENPGRAVALAKKFPEAWKDTPAGQRVARARADAESLIEKAKNQ